MNLKHEYLRFRASKYFSLSSSGSHRCSIYRDIFAYVMHPRIASLISIFFIAALSGYSNNSIVYDSSRKTWAIIDKSMNPKDLSIDNQDYRILAYLVEDKSSTFLPTGLNIWKFPESKSTEIIKLTKVITTKLVYD